MPASQALMGLERDYWARQKQPLPETWNVGHLGCLGHLTVVTSGLLFVSNL
jgi:hypothetical protein